MDEELINAIVDGVVKQHRIISDYSIPENRSVCWAQLRSDVRMLGETIKTQYPDYDISLFYSRCGYETL